MSERWCDEDKCPVSICGGPHVATIYPELGVIIEHADHIGEFLTMFGEGHAEEAGQTTDL
jgi:hypothetical protein